MPTPTCIHCGRPDGWWWVGLAYSFAVLCCVICSVLLVCRCGGFCLSLSQILPVDLSVSPVVPVISNRIFFLCGRLLWSHLALVIISCLPDYNNNHFVFLCFLRFDFTGSLPLIASTCSPVPHLLAILLYLHSHCCENQKKQRREICFEPEPDEQRPLVVVGAQQYWILSWITDENQIHLWCFIVYFLLLY